MKKKASYNAIPTQMKTEVSRFQSQEWNHIINVLKEQANYNALIIDESFETVDEIKELIEYTIEGNILTTHQKEKLLRIYIDGFGEKFLADDGTYKVPEILSYIEKRKLNMLELEGDEKKVLTEAGYYKHIGETVHVGETPPDPESFATIWFDTTEET